MPLEWFGDKVLANTKRRARAGVNITMSQAVIYAKHNHDGWKNITTKAEGSIQIIDQARVVSGGVQGEWGSIGVGYMIWLELNHGGALRGSAAVMYPNLARNIRNVR